MSQPRVFQIDRRLLIATGRARAEVVEALCEAAVTELEYNEPKEVSWRCQADENRGYFVAIFERLRNGEPMKKRLTHEQLERAASAFRLAYERQTDPAMIDAYEARTLEGASTAREVNIPGPKGGVQVLGRLLSVTYDGTLQGQDALWKHEFKEDAQPLLTADSTGRLFLVGGRYRVDDVGIVDKTPDDLPGGFEEEDIIELEEVRADFDPRSEMERMEQERATAGTGAFGDPAAVEDPQELSRLAQLFLEAVPNAKPDAVQQGLAAYERLHQAIGSFSPLDQAQAAAALFVFRPPKPAQTRTGAVIEALERVTGARRSARGRAVATLGVEIAYAIFGTPKEREASGRFDALPWDRIDREAIRDAKAAAIFGTLLNDVYADQLHPVVAGIENLKNLKKPELAGLARLALGSAPKGEKSWSATTKAKLLDALEHGTGAEANPARVEFHREPTRHEQGQRVDQWAIVSDGIEIGSIVRQGPPEDALIRVRMMDHPDRQDSSGMIWSQDTMGDARGGLAAAKKFARGEASRMVAVRRKRASENPAFSRDPLGEGGRFAACVRKMRQREDVYDPKGLCASIGRRKYGAKEFAKMAARGRQNPYAPELRARLGEIASFTQSNPTRTPVGLTSSDIDFLIYNVIPGYQADLEAHMPSDEDVAAAPHLLRIRENLKASHQRATELSRKLDWLAEHEWKNPLGFEEEEIEIGPVPFETEGARARRTARDPGSRRREAADWLEAELERWKLQNPAKKYVDGRWHRWDGGKYLDLGTSYLLDAGDSFAAISKYQPRKHPGTEQLAKDYLSHNHQELPKGKPWIATVVSRQGSRFIEPVMSAHKTLSAAKKAAESALRRMRRELKSNPVVANAGLLAGAPARHEGFGLDARLTNAGLLASPGGPHANTLGLSRVNAGLLDPPQVRRTMPRQP